jgi:hypothetical protein
MLSRPANLMLIWVLIAAQSAAQSSLPQELRDSSRAAVTRDVKYLASETLVGRATGSPGADSAANYLAGSYQAMQVNALLKTRQCDTAGWCRRTYFQPFRLPTALLRRVGIDTMTRAYNVLAALDGTDSTLRGQWLVVGAHYDHLGRLGLGALDRSAATEPHLGADDNASGTAAVLELARRLSRAPTRRPVLFINFSAEEEGEIGSLIFVSNAPVPTDSIVAMFNFDMVGRLRSGRLMLYGLESSRNWRKLVDSANTEPKLSLDEHDELGPKGTGSDHDRFYSVGVPVLHFFTGLHADYHTRHDTSDRINFDGMVQVIDFAERVIREVGDMAETPKREKRR